MPVNGLQQHYLRPLLLPESVAIVGASERAGSIGRIVFENAIRGEFAGELHAVNPRHREVLGRKSWPNLAAIGKPIDLAIIAAPPQAVRDVLEEGGGAAGPRAAIMLSHPPDGDVEQQRKWTLETAVLAARRGVRLVGPGAFGLVRSDIGLNASITDVPVARGGLALIAQSGALCTAMLDFAATRAIGFSTVASLGAGVDIGFGELLDCMLFDGETDGILLYIESVGAARPFLSALRAAARAKPVIVLKAGRSDEGSRRGRAPSEDAVFDAALRRAGTVRVRTYTQLFAAARILSLGRIPRGNRLAIVANGRGPALLAADTASESGVRLAEFDANTRRALDALLPSACDRANPVDVRADAPPERLAAAVAATLADENVDAVVALHVPRPSMQPADAARAVAAVARGADKPVLAAWLGAVERSEATELLEAGAVANFYTPENAVEAFSFLAAYSRHQQWLLEVPPPGDELRPPDLAAAAAVRDEALAKGRTTLTDVQASRLLEAFGIHAMPAALVANVEDAKHAARKLGYPVSLGAVLSQPDDAASSLRYGQLHDGRAVARAFRALDDALRGDRRDAAPNVVVRKEAGDPRGVSMSLGVYPDPTFGPVISLGASADVPLSARHPALMLPPLNRRLAVDLVDGLRARERDAPTPVDAVTEAMVQLALKLSSLVCALPWVVEIELDPLTPVSPQPVVGGMRIGVDFKRVRVEDYAHMAIHPYPAELVSEVHARNGTPAVIRPIRPEDAILEREFVNSLSDETRYLRFFHRMHELTPAMLARFTQVDYDRELALVAVVADPKTPEKSSFAGVARYIQNPDRTSAEYAVVVHDAWQGQGLGQALMERLIDAAKRKGLARLEGAVLNENAKMLKFVQAIGFTALPDPGDAQQTITALDLTTPLPSA